MEDCGSLKHNLYSLFGSGHLEEKKENYNRAWALAWRQ